MSQRSLTDVLPLPPKFSVISMLGLATRVLFAASKTWYATRSTGREWCNDAVRVTARMRAVADAG